MMNIRQKTILIILLQGNRNKINDLAEKFGVGNRTIRNDIKDIESFLRSKFDESYIVIEEGWVSLTQPDILSMDEVFSDVDYYDYHLSSKERFLLILADLCSSSGYTTISSLADRYFVSRATINSDIVAMKEYASKHGIAFVSERGKGLKIEGSEKERRKYLTQIMSENAGTGSMSNRLDSYSQWFSKEMLNDISKILVGVELKNNVFLSDIAFETLTIHIALAIKRFEEGLTINEDLNVQKQDSIQYKMSEEIVSELNKHFNISLPEFEAQYISIHLGSKSSELLIEGQQRDSQLEYYAFEIIRRINSRIEKELLNDEKLFESLYQHLVACKYRVTNKMRLQNPLKEELIETFPDLFEIIQDVIRNLNIKNIIECNQDEVSYILIHIATALRRTPQVQRKLKALLVCGTGVGTAELLRESLKRSFDFNIVDSIAKHQVNNYLETNPVEIIVSTVNLETQTPHVVVSPLVTKEDIVKISKLVTELKKETLYKQTKEPKSKTALEIEEIIEKYGSDTNEQKLIEEIKNTILNKQRKERQVLMLSDLLTLDTIELKVDCTDWKDSIQKSGDLLLKHGYISQTYIDDSINNVNELGPYIVITKGIALPHAFNSKGVQKTGLSLLTLSTPVEFGSEHNDPVHSVLMLSTTDAVSHLAALSDLSDFLGRKEFVEILKDSNDPQDIVNYIKENEEGKGGNQ